MTSYAPDRHRQSSSREFIIIRRLRSLCGSMMGHAASPAPQTNCRRISGFCSVLLVCIFAQGLCFFHFTVKNQLSEAGTEIICREMPLRIKRAHTHTTFSLPLSLSHSLLCYTFCFTFTENCSFSLRYTAQLMTFFPPWCSTAHDIILDGANKFAINGKWLCSRKRKG